ncbi:NADH-quinone oxidoreductase subunit F [Sporobacter termitidis DSM 10068]|uniref:NADH-quinone oxidoreductase subunit F n=1 Tax=Sporobacter termitidis DSM 10068 TaxID=1123282 RepID=A0A1M5VS68_9FIRM|nr:NADH-quinone oxidoreductase subunit NuoF [Sporobacter termitidis]SHH77773.1 NADH-quinone oxidoreductase subunit F [Sporobacter termitidis DSM 10068]
MKIVIGLGSCGIAAGGLKVKKAFQDLLSEHPGLNVSMAETGCMGMCYKEVMVEIIDDNGNSTIYGEVNEEKAKQIFDSHVLGGTPVRDYVVRSSTESNAQDSFFAKQQRIVLARCGHINPESIDEALHWDAYKGLEKALKTMTPEQVIDEVLKSGLKGRGGAGFPTGQKWKFARAPQSEKKYIICNADEGDPGAFMDRSVLEGDPHAVLEGLLIGGYAIGADEGYIYCRAEYPIAIKRLKIAIEQAKERGYLGQNILGTGFNFKIKIKEGAGAFVCGEETALIASIEGQRGMPRMRPPFPANKGLFAKPSNINNVETLANIGWIIRNGADKFAEFGTAKSKGTKVFALAGKIARGGLVEVPIGIPLKEIIFDTGGGTSSGKPFKAVQMGGPSGGCIPANLVDTIVDYEELNATGAIMGSGGMIVMDEDNCMVDIARYFLNFTQSESCGKCTYCKIGTKRMLEILTRITEGNGTEEDIPKLLELAEQIKKNALCGLGQTAPNPVLTTLRYFRDEYEAHIRDKKCPAKQCKSLIQYSIDPEKCVGCTVCAKNCPVKCISGTVKKPHTIDQTICTKCGTCKTVCKFGAVSVD